MKERYKSYIKKIEEYLKVEGLCEDGYKIECNHENLQKNNFDCGLFTLRNISGMLNLKEYIKITRNDVLNLFNKMYT